MIAMENIKKISSSKCFYSIGAHKNMPEINLITKKLFVFLNFKTSIFETNHKQFSPLISV